MQLQTGPVEVNVAQEVSLLVCCDTKPFHSLM